MDQLTTPRWTVQLVHGEQALAAWLERLRALTRLKWADIQPLEGGGFSLSLSLQSLSALQAWLSKFPYPEHLFRVTSHQLDDYGNYVVVLNPDEVSSALQTRAVICGWGDRPKAVEFLRSISPGQEPGNTSFIYSWHIVSTLRITEAPLNGQDLPANCKTDWGTLLRLSPEKAEEALAFLCVDQPADCSVPLVVQLSPTLVGIFGWGRSDVEPLRIALAGSWATAIAVRDIGRWMKSLTPRKKAAAGAKGNP